MMMEMTMVDLHLRLMTKRQVMMVMVRSWNFGVNLMILLLVSTGSVYSLFYSLDIHSQSEIFSGKLLLLLLLFGSVFWYSIFYSLDLSGPV